MEKKNIWNKLLILVIIIAAALFAVFLVMRYQSSRKMDLSHSYSSGETELSESAKAEGFSKKLVVSDNSVNQDGLVLTSDSEKALLFNLDDKSVKFAQNIYERTYPASITKIMTAILVLKYGNMDDTVTMTDEDFALEEGSQVSGMISGDTLTMRQLFNTLLIYSANDAAMAIARHIGGTVENFVAMMNEEAKKLGMIGSNFENPHGLHSENHYTCAYDVYLMLNEALNYSDFRDTIQMSMYTLTVTGVDGAQRSYRLDSTDKYLTGVKSIPDGISLWGGKTGTTPQAGSCLALAGQNKKGIPYIAVILNADNSSILYTDMSLLLSSMNDNY